MNSEIGFDVEAQIELDACIDRINLLVRRGWAGRDDREDIRTICNFYVHLDTEQFRSVLDLLMNRVWDLPEGQLVHLTAAERIHLFLGCSRPAFQDAVSAGYQNYALQVRSDAPELRLNTVEGVVEWLVNSGLVERLALDAVELGKRIA